MSKFENLKKNIAIIMGMVFVAVTLPYICANMSKVEAVAHSHTSHITDGSEHLNTIECCTNGKHSSMHILSATLSDFRLPAPINSLGLLILVVIFTIIFSKVYFPRNQTFSFLIGGIRLLRPPRLC